MIELQQVTKTYPVKGGQPVTAVHDVTLDIPRGDFLVITGRSGSGKTTLLNLVAGLSRPTAGRVVFGGKSLTGLSDREMARLRNRKIGFIFQFPSLLPSLTVLENVRLPALFAPESRTNGSGSQAARLLETVGLADKTTACPRQLSAGQQQRAVIARALLNQPQVLLADEPTSNLDEDTEREIMDLFQEIHAATGITILMVTHSSQLVPYGTRAFEMAAGTLRPRGMTAPSAAASSSRFLLA